MRCIDAVEVIQSALDLGALCSLLLSDELLNVYPPDMASWIPARKRQLGGLLWSFGMALCIKGAKYRAVLDPRGVLNDLKYALEEHNEMFSVDPDDLKPFCDEVYSRA
eukprot:gene18658-biopygen673